MTEAEAEKLAGEYAKPFANMTRYDYVEEKTHVKEAFIAGYKAGYEAGYFEAGYKVNKSKWHNLQDNPNDLPPYNERVLICYNGVRNIAYYNKNYEEWYCNNGMVIRSVYAWCELPKFEEM